MTKEEQKASSVSEETENSKIVKEKIEEAIEESSLKKTSEKVEEKIKKENTEETSEEIKKEVKKREERIGILNIYTTFNNTIINMTDLAGNTIAKYSGGQSTKQSRLKANPTIAMFVAQRISEEARDNGITGFYVRIRAETGQSNPGPGAHSAIKALTRAGFKIISIMDSTKMPRGGPKGPHGRRGRRV